MTSGTHTAAMDLPQAVEQRQLFTFDVCLRIALLTLAFGAFFYAFLLRQAKIAIDDADWSHALIIPLMSVYFIYTRREHLLKIDYRPFWPGFILMIAGMVGYVVFTAVSALWNHTIQGGMAVLALLGLVIGVLGWRSMRVLFFPIAYLLFGITIGDRVMFYATAQLKMIAAQGSWVLLNVSNVDTDRMGSVLRIYKADGTEIPLDVAEACSGMRMIVAFIALGVAIAFLSCRTWWQRVTLVILALPVAIVVNILRVTTLGWLSLIDPEMAGGDFHMMVGVLWLFPALMFYLGIVWFLNRLVITEPIRAMEKRP